MTTREAVVQEVLRALDTLEGRHVTKWEGEFLASLLRQTYPLTEKQHAVLVTMAEEYLEDHLLVAELRGQLRLRV